MTELEIMQRAQMYIDSLSRGIDPLTGQPVLPDDIVKNARISRCLSYVSGVLGKVIDNGGEVVSSKPSRAEKEPFSLTDEQIDALLPTVEHISASKLAGIINGLIDPAKMHKLTASAINEWLAEAGLVFDMTDSHGIKRRSPTPQGEALGISEQETSNSSGVYRYIAFDKNAQQFVFDNLPAIIETSNRESEQKQALRKTQRENKNKPWSDEETARLCTMHQNGLTLKAISAELQRTRRSVKDKLISLGILNV